jgi:hypothetical protein
VRPSARVTLLAALVLALPGCTVTSVTGEPVAAPQETVAPPADPGSPTPGPAPTPEPVESPVAEGPVMVWDAPAGAVELTDGWTLRDCDGDAPLWCFVAPDGEERGTLEYSRRTEDERFMGATDDADRWTRLHAVHDDLADWIVEDRSVGCPGHTVAIDPVEDRIVEGAPALVRGFVMTDPDGAVVESSLAVHVATGDDHVWFAVTANAPDSCQWSDTFLELTPDELAVVREAVVGLIERSPLPAPTA